MLSRTCCFMPFLSFVKFLRLLAQANFRFFISFAGEYYLFLSFCCYVFSGNYSENVQICNVRKSEISKLTYTSVPRCPRNLLDAFAFLIQKFVLKFSLKYF